MAGTQGKLRLLYLMKIFLEETDEDTSLSAQALLERLAAYGCPAERKSLYDNIETLRTFGMDIVMRQDRGFSYFLASRRFQLAELRLLVDAVQSSKFITHRKSAELIRKVESLCSRAQAGALQRQVFVSNRIKTMNESVYYNIDAIHAAISGDRQVEFHYYEWAVEQGRLVRRMRHGGKLYRVSPWALIWDDENYYMVAYDSDAGHLKHYRVDKMLHISVSSLARDGKQALAHFDAAEYARGLFGMFSGEQERVRVRFANRLAGVVADRCGKDVHIQPDGPGHFTATLRAADGPQFIAWLFSFGTEAEVLYPPHVAEELRRQAAAVCELYDSQSQA